MHFQIFIGADTAQCIDISIYHFCPESPCRHKKPFRATKGVYKNSPWFEFNMTSIV